MIKDDVAYTSQGSTEKQSHNRMYRDIQKEIFFFCALPLTLLIISSDTQKFILMKSIFLLLLIYHT